MNKFPIRIPNEITKQKTSELVTELLKLNEIFNTKQNMFLDRLKSEFNTIKINRNLKFYNLDKNEILSFIKLYGKNISLMRLDEWETYFLTYKKEIIDILNKIYNLERQIDNMIYELYEISSEEQIIIENKISY